MRCPCWLLKSPPADSISRRPPRYLRWCSRRWWRLRLALSEWRSWPERSWLQQQHIWRVRQLERYLANWQVRLRGQRARQKIVVAFRAAEQIRVRPVSAQSNKRRFFIYLQRPGVRAGPSNIPTAFHETALAHEGSGDKLQEPKTAYLQALAVGGGHVGGGQRR